MHPHVILVTGPPAAGKTTYVREHAEHGDLVIDFDVLAVALGSKDTHNHPRAVSTAAFIARQAVLRHVRKGSCRASRVWLVSANPLAAQTYEHDELVVVNPGVAVVRERIERERPGSFTAYADDWFRRDAGPVQYSQEW